MDFGSGYEHVSVALIGAQCSLDFVTDFFNQRVAYVGPRGQKNFYLENILTTK